MNYKNISNAKQFEVIELSDEELKVVSLNQLKKIEKSAIEFDGFVGHRNCGTLDRFIQKCITSEKEKTMSVLSEISEAISSGNKDRFHWANRQLKIMVKEYNDGKEN